MQGFRGEKGREGPPGPDGKPVSTAELLVAFIIRFGCVITMICLFTRGSQEKRDHLESLVKMDRK